MHLDSYFRGKSLYSISNWNPQTSPNSLTEPGIALILWVFFGFVLPISVLYQEAHPTPPYEQNEGVSKGETLESKSGFLKGLKLHYSGLEIWLSR